MNHNPFNPFITGNAVKDPAYFVGRVRESNDILAKIRGNNSVSIVGERRIGKSSLLNFLQHLCQQQLSYRKVIHFDFLNSETKTLEGFAYWLLGQLRMNFDDDELTLQPNIVLTRRLRLFNTDNPPPIILLDEFDKIQQLPAFFNDDFLENLRSLCNKGHICCVTATKVSLRSMIDNTNLTSPFWNVFTHTPLGEFAVDTYLDERALFIDRYWRAELTPTAEERAFLASYPTRHPLEMQIVSFNLCQNRFAQYKRTDEQLRTLIDEQIAFHFHKP